MEWDDEWNKNVVGSLMIVSGTVSFAGNFRNQREWDE